MLKPIDDHIVDALAPIGLGAVEADIARLPQEDRVKLALLLIRDVDEACCASRLLRLANLAQATLKDIRRKSMGVR